MFCPDEGAVAGYGNWIRVKYPQKWGVQMRNVFRHSRSFLGKKNLRYEPAVSLSTSEVGDGASLRRRLMLLADFCLRNS
ncbi:MAG: DUF6783 domain-containing protein [Blautia wexlerae]